MARRNTANNKLPIPVTIPSPISMVSSAQSSELSSCAEERVDYYVIDSFCIIII